MNLKFPIDLSFKLLAIASQIYIRDNSGQLVGYVKQKLFKLKEDINVFADEGQTKLLFNIKADRVLDFSARYNFSDGSGRIIGSIKRQGRRSIWRANYDILDAGANPVMRINEESGWIKVADSLIGELPVIGMFTGYFMNPSYIVSRVDGTPAARLTKQPALFEGRFRIELLGNESSEDEIRILLGSLTMTLLERSRG